MKGFCGVCLLVAVRKHLRLGFATAALRGKAVECDRMVAAHRFILRDRINRIHRIESVVIGREVALGRGERG